MAMLTGAKPSNTTSSGSLTTTMPVKARAANSSAVLSAAVRHQQPNPGRDHQAGRGRGKSAEGVPENREVSELEVKAAKRQPDCPRYQNETRDRGDCPERAHAVSIRTQS